MKTKEEGKKAMRKTLAPLSLVQLVEAFELTSKQNGPEIPVVREVLMDELEDRNVQAFEAWMDSVTDSPRSFFLAA
ncbi:hypothetical protein SAMN05216370_0034 [Pseudomonas peli]|uniref:Uncharacterized protein n=1 Tax=Pseudomonas peli TaxID=592361 RepID=A0AB37ZDU3_9PSED|nr:hypothetical protein [Pseudomonas peli]NMZ71353.1 hypothetical protein [Pseudomonas peli]SCW89367.1 hypothetical protein SAMN05216370_0034 [Pseudomonas peli]